MATNHEPGFLREIGRRVPWRVATAFGLLFGLSWAAIGAMELSAIRVPYVNNSGLLGLAIFFAAGFVGASRGRQIDQGFSAVLVAIFIGFAVAMIAGPLTVLAVSSQITVDIPRAMWEATDVPLPQMLLLGLPVGALGAGLATWLRHLARSAV